MDAKREMLSYKIPGTLMCIWQWTIFFFTIQELKILKNILLVKIAQYT